MALCLRVGDESDIGTAGVGPVSIVLAPRNLESEDELVSAVNVARLHSVAEQIVGPVAGHVRRRAEPLQTDHVDAGAQGVFRRGQHRGGAIEGDGGAGGGGGGPIAAPRHAAVVGKAGGVRVLPSHELERGHLLAHVAVLKRQLVAAADVLVEVRVPVLPVHALGRIGIQHPGIDVGAIGSLIRIGVENELDVGAQSRAGGQRSPFRRQGNQHVPVHHAAGLLLAGGEGEVSSAPERRFHIEAVLVVVGGHQPSHLKEGSRPESAVLMGLIQPSMRLAPLPRRNVQPDGGRNAVFRAEVAQVRQELGNQGGRRANPHQKVLKDVQVHRGHRDVLIAFVFSGRGVGLGHLHFRASRLGRGDGVFRDRRIRRLGLAGGVAASARRAWLLRLGRQDARQQRGQGKCKSDHVGSVTAAVAFKQPQISVPFARLYRR